MPTLFPSALLTNTYTNSSCNGTGLNWYINLVGETPCSTYERLHQICNPPFQVGVMTPPTSPASPPDTCMDQVAANKELDQVAMALMQGLILRPQGLGEYQLYLQGSRPVGQRCFPNVNQSLWWPTGDWYYEDVAAADGNVFTHCENVTGTLTSTFSPTSSALSSNLFSSLPDPTSSFGNGSTTVNPSQTPAGSSAHLSKGALGGITSGAIVGVFCILFVLWLYCSSKTRSKGGDTTHTVMPFANVTAGESGGLSHTEEATTEISPSFAHQPWKAMLGRNQESRWMQSQQTLGNHMSSETDNRHNSPRLYHYSDALYAQTDTPLELRHRDAGPVQIQMVQRGMSGILPPAYGDQIP
ncbi:hypothetical protein C8R41DRAFT_900904 [Lentinula lateritia]|uniref:Uncharacterized protein n=1 Tax=Lentinula lateritia TaxID=40482 RepID=A0ABQ8VTC7_9AGAR|nr:hypothetical protein C8R41DRAFT_900904 [Lentinula lateritia]